MESGTKIKVIEVSSLQFAVAQVVAALNALFVGEVKGWRQITQFHAKVKEDGDILYVFICPAGWPLDRSFISCRLRKVLNDFSAEEGEVRAHHLTMPMHCKTAFSFSFEIASIEGFFLLSPKRTDAESIRLFARMSRHVPHYR